jgi:hypothetical protein
MPSVLPRKTGRRGVRLHFSLLATRDVAKLGGWRRLGGRFRALLSKAFVTGKGFHGVMSATGPELVRESVGSLRLSSGCNSRQHGAGHQAQILGKGPSDNPGSQDAPPDDRRGSSGVQEASSTSALASSSCMASGFSL